MKKLATFVLSTMALSASFSAPASADQYANKGGAGFKVDRSTLQQAEFYNHPREYQILDIRPTLRDFRKPPQSVNVINIDAGPLNGSPGRQTNIGDPSGGSSGANAPFRNADTSFTTLPQSGFGSDPNAILSRPNVGPLPDGRSIGSHAPVTSQQVNGRMSPRERLNQKQSTALAAQPLTYKNPYGHSPSVSTGGSNVNTNATGRLLPFLKRNTP